MMKTERLGRKVNTVLLLFTVVCFLQLSGLKGVANYISAGIMCLIAVLSLKMSNGKVHIETVCIIIFLIFYVLTSILYGSISYCLTYSINYFLMLSPAMMFPVFAKMINDSETLSGKDVLRPILVSWFIMTIISIAFYIQNPSAARVLAANGDAYSGTLIGGYPLAYGSGLLCVAFFGYGLKEGHDKNKRLLILLSCAILFALVYLTESTLTTFATIVGVAVALITNTRSRGKRKALHYVAVVGLLCVLALYIYVKSKNNIPNIVAWLNSKSDVLLYRRVRELFNSFFLNEKSRHYSERTGLVSESLKLFVESPLIGHGYKYGNIFSQGKAYGIGNHSEFFDCLAKFGLIGSMPLFSLYFNSLRKSVKYNYGLLASFIMMISFNPFITFASSVAVFLIVPLMYLTKEEGQQD